MDSLDNIWDEAVDEVPARRQSDSFSHEPLFLADSDEENAHRAPRKNLPDIDVDIDAMFAEVEAEDDPFSFKPLTSDLNTEALTREAEARHKRPMPSLTPHAIMSSSPPRDPSNDRTSNQADGQKGKEGRKERSKPARLDEGRLLGPNGFPKLIKDTKNFKIKGKGHEATDLNRLLQVYGYWTHEMFPRTTFRDTVERIEKLCHSKRMHVALGVWRDEEHGLINGRKPEDDDEVIDLTEIHHGDATLQSGSSRASSPASNGAAYASSSSRLPSRPPSSTSGLDDDDFDIDAVIHEEEETMQAVTPSSKGGEDDAMWNEIDTLQDATKSTHPPPVQDEDEDMWDVLREMENDDAARKPKSPSVAPDPDDDWDSVYA
ncbi:Chromosome segregation in meiosis protein 3 [Termitomyces sp. J132]|nr:Chromosome segregation in meiosis protein 3 [Termitomyces sp. J132]